MANRINQVNPTRGVSRMVQRLVASGIAFCLCYNVGQSATLWSAAPYIKRQIEPKTVNMLCDAIGITADKYALPKELFARLIWQESRFDTRAMSSNGSYGVAKLNKTTVAEAANIDPFDFKQALPAAAAYVARLRNRFGNMESAVAGFAIGEKEVAARKSDGDRLPANADNLVFEVIGTRISYSAPSQQSGPLATAEQPIFAEQCRSFAAAEAQEERQIEQSRRWAAIVAGNWKREAVVSHWETFAAQHVEVAAGIHPSIDRWVTPLGHAGVYAAKVYMNSRSEADGVCDRLHSVGSVCVVLRN